MYAQIYSIRSQCSYTLQWPNRTTWNKIICVSFWSSMKVVKIFQYRHNFSLKSLTMCTIFMGSLIVSLYRCACRVILTLGGGLMFIFDGPGAAN